MNKLAGRERKVNGREPGKGKKVTLRMDVPKDTWEVAVWSVERHKDKEKRREPGSRRGAGRVDNLVDNPPRPSLEACPRPGEWTAYGRQSRGLALLAAPAALPVLAFHRLVHRLPTRPPLGAGASQLLAALADNSVVSRKEGLTTRPHNRHQGGGTENRLQAADCRL